MFGLFDEISLSVSVSRLFTNPCLPIGCSDLPDCEMSLLAGRRQWTLDNTDTTNIIFDISEREDARHQHRELDILSSVQSEAPEPGADQERRAGSSPSLQR